MCIRDRYNHNDVVIDSDFYLRKYISSDLKSSEFKEALEYIFFLKEFYSGRGVGHFGTYIRPCPNDNLGSTPMNDAIIVAHNIVSDFKKKTGVQICNILFLTDGASNPVYHFWDATCDGGGKSKQIYGSGLNAFFYDEESRKTFSKGGRRYNSRADETAFLLEALGSRCNSRILGFFVLPPSGRAAKNDLSDVCRAREDCSVDLDELYNKLKKLSLIHISEPTRPY